MIIYHIERHSGVIVSISRKANMNNIENEKG